MLTLSGVSWDPRATGKDRGAIPGEDPLRRGEAKTFLVGE